MPCNTCDHEGDLGIFEGITLTVVCTTCASAAVTDEGHSVVCFSKARDAFPSISPKRLQRLGSTPRKNPYYKNGAPMRMYSLAELRVTQIEVTQELVTKADVQEKKRHTRLERLVRVHNISPASPIHRALFEHIFGDYVCAKNPKKRLKEIKSRLLAHDVSVRLCPADPVCAMNYLEERGITAFASEDLQKEFEYSLCLTARVLRLEGLSIARYIYPKQLAQLEGGPLKEIPASINRLKKNSPRMLRMSLKALGFDSSEMERMISCSETRVRRCYKYAHDPEAVAKKISEFWLTRKDRAHRRRILQEAMEKKGLEIRDDSVYCHDFIFGLVDVDLDEIVGIQYITRELFDTGGSRFWSEYHHACESAFRQALLENGNDMNQSIAIAIRKYASRKRWFF